VPNPPTLEDALRDLSRIGTLVKDHAYRQVWRFEHGGKAYFLKFYPKGGVRDRWRRRFRGSPAMREFVRLQWLQKAKVPAPRAVSALMGLRLQDRIGDAVILQAIEPNVQLDLHLNGLALRGERDPNHRDIARQVGELVHTLGKGGLGHNDLHLGNFLLHDGKVFLLDAYAVQAGGLRKVHVLQLGHSVSRFATRTDLIRGWRELGGGDELPKKNPVGEKHFANLVENAAGGNRYFGRIDDGEWAGPTFKQMKYPRRWSTISQMTFSDEDWEKSWATLRKQIEADSLEVLKRTASGDVMAGELSIAGQSIPVIVKHPRRKYWYRWINEIARGSRANRAWFRSWEMIARNVPVACPLLMVERRTLGYVTDGIIVFERVPGQTLARVDLDAIEPKNRDMLFRRCGRVLRKIDGHGYTHLDAKNTNFIVLDDDKLGPSPVLVDMDGIRRRAKPGAGIERLLRAMKKHPQYTVADSLALCQGLAPYARLHQEEQDPQATVSEKIE
jgi:tRNA A-37 threonylcarbamoyl transferase component Bud32